MIDVPVTLYTQAGELLRGMVRCGRHRATIEAQDIANDVLFLCTEDANYMTEQDLVIDGGMTAGGRPPQRQ